jgi:putative oxidoreductase
MVNSVQKGLNILNARRDEWILIIRFCLGIIFIQSGWGKLMHFSQTVDFFTQLNIPLPSLNALIATLIEFIGGILLVVGFATRFVSIALIVVMAVAILTAQLPEITAFVDILGLQEWDYILFFGMLTTLGAGRWSLDGLIRRIWL